MSIKYYHLAKDETPPEEFCAIKDVGGEPSEYMFYVPEAENAKLRKERDHWHVEQVHAYGNWEDAHKLVIKLEVENAELRELASILCFCMQIHKQCDDCKLNGAKGEIAHDPLLACDGLHAMLREFGIEVPE